MIADSPNNCYAIIAIKIFVTPKLQTLRALFFCLFMFGTTCSGFSQSSFNVDTLIQWVNTHPRNDSTRIHYMHRISYLLSETDVDKSFAYYEQVSKLSDSLHFTYGMSLANINLGILLSSAGDLEASTKAYFKAADLAKACGARRLESVSLNNIGDNFAMLKNFDKSRQYALEAIEINSSIKAWRGVALNYELLSRCDLEQGLYAEAKMNLDKGMPFAVQTNENYVLSQFYLGYGKFYAVTNENDSANYYFDKAIASARETPDIRNEFQAYLAEARYKKHITGREKTMLLRKALQLADQTHFAEGKSKAAEQLSTAYYELKNLDSSMFYYKLYRTTSDSLFSENNRRNVIVNESEWTIKKKELENNTLIELTNAQKRQIAFKDILLFLTGIGFMLAIFITFLLYKSFQAKKLKDDSQYKQKIAETEMQALQAQMNPHFFFNSLNSIENFIMQNEKKLASDYLNKFARFIRSILDSSYTDLIELNKDIESLQLYIDLEQLRFNNKFSYCCQVDPLIVQGDYHVPALLVQPFLENAINHGIGPSERTDLKICVKVKLINNMIHYIIQDNGIGRDQSKIYNQLNKPFHKSVGMKLTQDRINIFNRDSGSSSNVKIIDLFDDENEPAGTRIEFAIKCVSYASPQSHSGR
ncbi:MAG TPA: histidine kinase [Puia sp.]|nr:histidine kinase [Puia sp.]